MRGSSTPQSSRATAYSCRASRRGPRVGGAAAAKLVGLLWRSEAWRRCGDWGGAAVERREGVWEEVKAADKVVMGMEMYSVVIFGVCGCGGRAGGQVAGVALRSWKCPRRRTWPTRGETCRTPDFNVQAVARSARSSATTAA